MDSKKAFLIPLLYSSIFHFPLTQRELWYFLPKKISYVSFLKTLSESHEFLLKDDFVTLKGKKAWIETRVKNEKKVIEKREGIKKLLAPLSFIPWILFVGISGSLGAGQYQKKGDIDLFFITKSHTLWITRCIVLLFLLSKGVLRTKTTANTTELVCVNMFLDETTLSFPKTQQDIYTAREIHQLYPVINKEKTYERFITKNSWTFTFFPNTKNVISPSIIPVSKVLVVTQFLNFLCYHFQLFSIRKTQTIETVSPHVAAFHPVDYRMRILGEFEAKTSTIPH